MKLQLLLFLSIFFLPLLTVAQIEFSLALAADGETYIVYAKPAANITISTNTVVGLFIPSFHISRLINH